MIKTFRAISPPIGIALVLAGCAAGPGSLEARYGDRNDVCYADRQPLIETESRFSESMVAGGLGGALLGAGMGALLSGGSAKGALIGGLTGGLTGTLGGYLYAKQQQAETREQLLASIDADATRDNQQIALTNSALDRLVACRQNEINQVAAQYRAKEITAAQAKTAYQMIAAQMADDGALINSVLGESNERASTYVSARTQTLGVDQAGNEARPPSQPPQNSTQAFARANQDAVSKEQQHARLRQDLQTRIDELSAATG